MNSQQLTAIPCFRCGKISRIAFITFLLFCIQFGAHVAILNLKSRRTGNGRQNDVRLNIYEFQ